MNFAVNFSLCADQKPKYTVYGFPWYTNFRYFGRWKLREHYNEI